MKKEHIKKVIFLGVICVLFMAASAFYAVAFNESRLVVPTDFSEYRFRVRDLPMLLSSSLLVLYVFYLFLLLVRAIIKNKEQAETVQTARRINPNFGFLGFAGLLGFLGFWTYGIDKTIFPFVFFMFFGFFGFFYEGKMSDVFMDERYRENKIKACLKADKIALTIIFAAILIFGQGKLMGNVEYTFIAFMIVVTLSIALEFFLREYFLYRYDHDDSFMESEE